MKQSVDKKTALCLGLFLLPLLLSAASAGQAKRRITGDWQVKVDFDGQQLPLILSFSEDDDGQIKGELIHLWGLGELSDIKHEGDALSFVQHYQSQGQERTAHFTGSVRRGQLSGTYSMDRGDFNAEGVRLRRMPAVAGEWETKLRSADREIHANLILKADDQRKLTADWKDPRGEQQITNVNFKAGKLTFDRKRKTQDRSWESSFEGKIKGHTLTGSIKSERGDIAVEGKRVGAALVGLWELDITTDSGSRKQLLRDKPRP